MSEPRRQESRATIGRIVRCAGAILALAVAGSLASCVAVVRYRPNTAFADGLEEAEARRAFGEVMTRVTAPRILSARISDHYYEYEIEESSRNMHGIPTGVTSRKVQRDFANLGRAQLHVNHVVYVFSKSSQLLDHLRFSDQNDAKVFIDLIMSYRDRLERSWSGRK